jgi:ubiquinone/menaquinone biosynthesis C-methylase UbiE
LTLSLSRQNQYRERYRQIRSGWRTSGEVYEALVRRYIGEGASEVRALDLGCGAGGVMELFSARVGLSVGVDPDLASLRGHRNGEIRLAAGRAESLPFEREAFDVVTCSWVLEHLRGPTRTFAEIARVLRKGGHLVFLTPNANSLIVQINRLVPRGMQHCLVRLFYGRTETDTFATAYAANSVQSIDTLARTAGLVRVEVHLVSDPTYLAFSEVLFQLSLFYESLISSDRYAHIVGDYVKE